MPSNGKGWIRESMRVCLMDRLFTFFIRFAGLRPEAIGLRACHTATAEGDKCI
jgi:hypothetical protein